MVNIVDSYVNEKNRVLLTNHEIAIQNLRSIGRATTGSAVMPLGTHIHKDCMEIVVIVKGRQTYIAGGEAYRLTGGDVFVSFVDEPHGTGECPQEMNEIIWFQIDMRYQNGFLGLSDSFGKLLHEKLASIETHLLKIEPSHIQTLKTAFSHMAKRTTTNIQIAQGLFVTFLNALVFAPCQSQQNCGHIDKALAYIHSHLHEAIDISILSKITNLSDSRLKHKFTQITGVTPNHYIHSRKIEEAKQLLRAHRSITETAMSLGYSSSSYFSSVFKKFTGLTPTDYLRQPQADQEER